MKSLRNRVQLIGNLGNDPIMKDVNGNKLAKFTMATNQAYTNKKGERIEDTQWHNLVVWGKLAELVERFVSKGKEIAVEGQIQTRSYDDADGNKRYITEIVAHDIVFLGTK